MKYSNLTARVGGDGADAWKVHYEARRAQERGEDVIVLSVGDPDLDAPPVVLERAIEALRKGDSHYTSVSGRDTLRAAIARTHRARSGHAATLENVIFLAGAQNALFAASLCIAGPGDEVVAFEPLYPTYPATIQASGACLTRVGAPAEAGFRVDLAALEAAITPRTRAIFFATPNNPSGVVISASELDVIGALARRHDLWIVADEVYAGLSPEGRVPSLAAVLPEQVITISSLSKTHAMPGWRAGWLVGPAELIRHIEALATCMLYGLPGFIQEGALAALDFAGDAEARVRAYCRERRDFMLARLQTLAGVRCFAPEAGMFMLIDVRATGLSGYDFMQELFREERVSVLDGGAFGAGSAGFVRLCFATDEKTLAEAAGRMRRFVEKRV